jgi:Flp pilus assembly protein TadB
MRGLVVLLALFATPAFAHHEVVVVGSLLPVIGGLATIASAGLVAFLQKRRRKRELNRRTG